MFLYQYINESDSNSGWFYASEEDITQQIGINAAGGDYVYFVFVSATSETEELNAAKKRKLEKTNNAIGAWISNFCVLYNGQESINMIKEQEASGAQKIIDIGGTPTKEEFPMIMTEVEVSKNTIQNIITSIKNDAIIWKNRLADIESIRQKTIRAIDSATDIETLNAIEIVFPSIA